MRDYSWLGQVIQHAKVSIVQCYTQTNDYDNIDKDTFYKQLQDVANKVPHHDVLLIMGDMNAEIIGRRSRYEHVLGLYAFCKWTENDERFIQFCTMNNMRIRMSLFDHKDIHRKA